jgi:hypothetical protein
MYKLKYIWYFMKGIVNKAFSMYYEVKPYKEWKKEKQLEERYDNFISNYDDMLHKYNLENDTTKTIEENLESVRDKAELLLKDKKEIIDLQIEYISIMLELIQDINPVLKVTYSEQIDVLKSEIKELIGDETFTS